MLSADHSTKAHAWIKSSDDYLRESIGGWNRADAARSSGGWAVHEEFLRTIDPKLLTVAALDRSMKWDQTRHDRAGFEKGAGLQGDAAVRAAKKQLKEGNKGEKFKKTLDWIVNGEFDKVKAAWPNPFLGQVGMEGKMPALDDPNELWFRSWTPYTEGRGKAWQAQAISGDFEGYLRGHRDPQQLAEKLKGWVGGSDGDIFGEKMLTAGGEPADNISKLIFKIVKKGVGGDELVDTAIRRAAVGFGGGFVPNFSKLTEMVSANVGAGYKHPVTAAQVRRTNIPGVGPSYYNTQERVVNTPGLKQPFIVPPRSSRAAPNYAREVQGKFGFNPYKSSFADGFVPNFAKGDGAAPGIDFTKFKKAVNKFGEYVEAFEKAMDKTLKNKIDVNMGQLKVSTDVPTLKRETEAAIAIAMEKAFFSATFHNEAGNVVNQALGSLGLI